MKNIGLTIHFWDYINIVKEYSKEVQEIYYLLKIKDTSVYNNPLYNSGHIIIDIEDETFDLLVEYLRTYKLSKKLKNIILEDIQIHLKEYKERKEKEIIKMPKKEIGYIYVIKSNGLYKIGRSKNIKSRIKLYKTENPFGIEVIFQKKVEDYINREAKLLDLFKDKLILGKEWFDLSDKEIDLIKNLIK